MLQQLNTAILATSILNKPCQITVLDCVALLWSSKPWPLCSEGVLYLLCSIVEVGIKVAHIQN